MRSCCSPAERSSTGFGARRLSLIGLALFGLGAGVGCSDVKHRRADRHPRRPRDRRRPGQPAALAGAVSGFPPERRGSALGIWGASAGVSNLIGPLLGGLLTVTLGWRAAWWALVPLALISAATIARQLPASLHAPEAESEARTLNGVVLAATLVAALTFAVMIGCFYLASQYLQRSAGYSALGASAALVIVALLVGAAAP